MIMYEHFVRGTEPYDECPLHSGAGLLTRLGGLFGGGSAPSRWRERHRRCPSATCRRRRRGRAGRRPRPGPRRRRAKSRRRSAASGAASSARARTRPPPTAPTTPPIPRTAPDAVPFRDLKGHRAQQTLLARAHRPRRAAAEPDLRRPGRRRQAARRARRRAAPQLPHRGPGRRRRLRHVLGLPPHRQRHASRRHDDSGRRFRARRRSTTSASRSRTRRYRPFEGRRRVFILDEADELQPVVQNALLKTLEEPTRSSQFILVTARPDGLLPTVRSRCPQLRFGRLDVDDVAALLVARQDLPALAAREIAFAADGSPGRAFADASALGESVRALAERVIGAAEASPAERLRVGAALAEPDKKAKRAPGTKAASERDMLRERLDALGVVVRDLGIEAAGGDRRWQSRTPDPRAGRPGAAARPARLANAYAAVEEARQALDRNVSFKAVADWVALEL